MYFTDLKIKLQNFFRKNKYKIYITLIVIAIIVTINIIIGKIKDAEPPSTSYTPHSPIVYGNEVKSKSVQKNIETSIQEYMDLCNKKDYESAYNLLTDDCKEYKFKNKLSNFKNYIDSIYDGNKIYSIQDYSNKDNIYIYQVTISEDIMATGKNTSSSDETYKEKIVITKDGNDYKLAVDGFIKKESLEKTAEDEYMKVYITEKITFYDKEIYKLKIKNKTDNVILLAKNNEKSCIQLSLNGDNREEVLSNYSNNEKAIYGGDTKTFSVTFVKYFDEKNEPTSIILDKVRILPKYTGVESAWEKELENAVKKYSATIQL